MSLDQLKVIQSMRGMLEATRSSFATNQLTGQHEQSTEIRTTMEQEESACR